MDYITPKQAFDITQHTRIDDCHKAMAVYKYATTKQIQLELQAKCYDKQWIEMVSLLAVYTAGRVSGIREERAKKRRTTTNHK